MTDNEQILAEQLENAYRWADLLSEAIAERFGVKLGSHEEYIAHRGPNPYEQALQAIKSAPAVHRLDPR